MNKLQEYKSIILDPKVKVEKAELDRLVKLLPSESILDHFLAQQRELIKIENPKKVFSKEELNEIQIEINKGIDTAGAGLWVYYPWRQSLIHVLDKEKFIKLRTSRNLYKITEGERELLEKKSVGIIGLSVGHSVVMNLALERSVGRLKLADFDDLELSNLNRIRSNILNIGLPKVIIAAREVAEIDPFIEVTCYEEGITEENIDDFFSEDGGIDVLIEECDSLNIKILARLKAKEYEIPVLMETSDRGMVDVERFDLEPSRPILHGMIDHLDYSAVKDLKTSEDKIPYLMPMVGIETMSPRLKASALEVGNTLTTWPQLGTSVMLGGAILADTYRRIVLGQFKKSGRFIVDPADVLGIDESDKHDKKPDRVRGGLSRVEMLQQVASLNRVEEVQIERDIIEEIVKAAGTAPSGGNSQPWKWLYSKGRLYLFLDRSSSDSFMDYKYSASYMALGAAYVNAETRAQALGYRTEHQLFPIQNNHALIVEICLYEDNEISNQLSVQIERRYTDRRILKKTPIAKETLDRCADILNDFPSLISEIIDSDERIKILGDVVSSGDWVRIMNPGSHLDFTSEEMRWTKEQLDSEKNGIYVEELSLSPGDLSGLYLLKDKRVIDFMNENDHGQGLKNVSSKLITSAPVMISVFSDKNNEYQFFEAGRLMEKLWLLCTEKNIGFQVLNVPLAFLLRYKNNDLSGLNQKFQDEIKEMAQNMSKVFHNYQDKTDMLLIRLFNSVETVPTSVRRGVEQILEFE